MRYLVLFTDEGALRIEEGDKHQVDVALTEYLHSGRDSVIHLTLLDGDEYATRASLVTGWTVSTPEGRVRMQELTKLLDDEERANRMEAGLGWDDE